MIYRFSEYIEKMFKYASRFLEDNTGWLVAVILVAGGFAIAGFMKDNVILLDNTNETAKDIKRIVIAQREQIKDADENVNELKRDNEQQTRILCRLILRGDVPLSTTEAQEIERICEEQIHGSVSQKGNSDTSSIAPSTPNTNKKQGSDKPRTNKPSAAKPPEKEAPEPKPSSLVDGIITTLEGVRNEVSKLFDRR